MREVMTVGGMRPMRKSQRRSHGFAVRIESHTYGPGMSWRSAFARNWGAFALLTKKHPFSVVDRFEVRSISQRIFLVGGHRYEVSLLCIFVFLNKLSWSHLLFICRIVGLPAFEAMIFGQHFLHNQRTHCKI